MTPSSDVAPLRKLKNQGQRVVVGQHALQSASDILLGWVTASSGDDFYVRQYRDWKYGVDLESITADQLQEYALWTAGTLAKSHAWAGDPIAIAACIGKQNVLPEAIVEFSLTMYYHRLAGDAIVEPEMITRPLHEVEQKARPHRRSSKRGGVTAVVS